ncbi:hypothetical protein IFM89_032159 [Coptis chinensis]|uniref:DNA repair protein UVH3 n=1 Tax=Coptis chinensis TaxID=261450 RepID=A0A835IYV7_9MAGN|nr:hypothetical protein IFM89_032159 [Coptis chinensis]
MGVHGLWELLSPVGRRVSVETLAGKKLAIDASIWMVQFIKAMRDEKGEMARNAHILGFFRRICKLLFLRTMPVFVFDGGTPAIKRRTVIARRRFKENAQGKIRKTAEKLLLNHLKVMRVKELAEKLEEQRKENEIKGKNVVGEIEKDIEKGKDVALELEKAKVDLKGKGVLLEDDEVGGDSMKGNGTTSQWYDQQTLDAMLAASLAAEEDGGSGGTASNSDHNGISEEGDGDGDEEMILPVMHGKVDPAILAALPPSMQLDLLVQMRERLMAENRQKYQKVKKAPEKFSELQIQSYLKTVAFRREINEVQKSAAGKGVGGVQTSRIASEANREYIFSSSFTGDKQTLTSAGVERDGDTSTSSSTNHISAVPQPSIETESGRDVPESHLNDVETYVDERGRLRVSRVRAMGIRMTRDLQRNLDLMKEIEQEKREDNHSESREAIFNKIVFGCPEAFSVNNHNLDATEGRNGVISNSDDDGTDAMEESRTSQTLENRTGLKVSFFEDDTGSKSTEDDDLFTYLVAGSSVALSPAKNDLSGEHPSDTASVCLWEDGINDEQGVSFSNVVKEENQLSLGKETNKDEDEVEWEEVVCDVSGNALPCLDANNKAMSRGSLMEEADLEEAIRRSIEDFARDELKFTSSGKENVEISREMDQQNRLIPDLILEKDEIDSLNLPAEKDIRPCKTSYKAAVGVKELDHVVKNDNTKIIESPHVEVSFSVEVESGSEEKETLMHRPCEGNLVFEHGILSKATTELGSAHRETPYIHPVSPAEPKAVLLIVNQVLDTSVDGAKESNFVGSICSSKVTSHVSAALMGDTTEENLVGAYQNYFEAAPRCHSLATTEAANYPEKHSAKELATSVHLEQIRVSENGLDVPAEEMRHNINNSTIQNNVEVPIEVSEGSLDEEMLQLRQERINLGEEQRKLERNAESVTSEMFAECQELLQMFGLPYIIAPMEAEAQCAYMELTDLVDGVVTDDSDVFLFGARSVYKNIFDDRKYVETYFMKDIESDLGLTREQLIRMALLLGSDYTEGVSGIGIVNAIEVVNAFPEEAGLKNFREWIESPDPTILGKLDTQTGAGSKKRGSKASYNGEDCSKEMNGGIATGGDVSEGHDNKQSTDDIHKTQRIFMDKHRNVSKNWHIPSSFPSEAVVSAYVSPQVDKSTDPFSWGKPDLLVLRKLCWEKFGWSNQKADELLVPVLKEYNKHETQLRLEAFYTFNERFAKIRSKRIKKAVKGITGKRSSDVMDPLPEEASTKRISPSGPDRIKENSFVEEDTIAENECSTSRKLTVKQSRRKKNSVPVSTEAGESLIEEEQRRSSRKGSSGNGRGRGRGRGRAAAKGRGKETPGHESTKTSSSNINSSNDELEMQLENTERLYEMRESRRPRKQVKYTEDDPETAGLSNPTNQTDIQGLDKEVEQEPVCEDICKDAGSNLSQKDGEPFSEDGCDYHEKGGGFCLDEDKDENDSPQVVSTSTRFPEDVNVSLEDGFSADYLAMGGGFCMDEGEPDTEPVQLFPSPTRDLDESTGRRVDDLIITDSLNPLNCIVDHDSTRVGVLQGDRLPKGDPSTTSTACLTPMPFLRRKRRKT